MIKKFIKAASCVGAISLISTASQAATVHLSGATVDFYYDDTQPGMAAYGTLSVVGDTIFAIPGAFRSESNDGTGIHTGTQTDTFSAYGVVQVVAKSGYEFSSINIGENGDYYMSAGSTASNASVGVNAQARIYDWAGGGVFGETQTQNLSITGDLTIRDGALHDWSGATSFDMSASGWDGITEIGLGLQNNLTAFSNEVGVSAWIQKKAVAGSVGMEIVTIPTIPVPAAIWLFGSGLLGLIGLSRRKKS